MSENEIQVMIAGIALAALVAFTIVKTVFWFIPCAWACDSFWGEHKAPKEQGFDGASSTGKCPRCEKGVLQDSQGGWF